MTIGIVINTSWNILNFRIGLIRFLQALGHEVIAIAPRDNYSDRLSELCRFVELPMDNKGANPFKDLKTYRLFKQTYAVLELELVLQYTIKPNIYGSMAAQKLGIPTINNVSGLGTIFIRKNFTSKIGVRLYKKAFKKASYVFFQNKDDKEVFIKHNIIGPTNRSGVLPGSGVDLVKFHSISHQPSSAEKTTFVMVARLLYDKGIREYLSAAEAVKNKYPDTTFYLYGFIETEAGLGIPKEELLIWEKNGVISYKGVSDDIIKAYAQTDAVVLPSYREGTPKTLLEAAACGKPIITTNVPGCKEVVNDGHNGILCKEKSSESLEHALIQFIESTEDTKRQMGLNSRTLAEQKFDENIVFKAYKEVIDSLWK